MSFDVIGIDIDSKSCREGLHVPEAGGFVSFEGWVRNHNEGREVEALEYEIFDSLARKEGKKIIEEAQARFQIYSAYGVHRKGFLGIGDMAVWVGVSAPHRREAFEACMYIIDEVKLRLPVWKKEHYVSGISQWVNCQGCEEKRGHDHRLESML